MMGYGYGYNMMGGWIGMMIVPIIVITIIIFIVYKISNNNNFKELGGKDKSLDILDERLARGEINEDEYNDRKKFLTNHKK